MGKASSTKKIARMAQRGRGKKIRFQGGTLFPAVVAVVVVIGLALVWYSRTSVSSAAPGPRASKGDHWHLAYGFYVCSDTENSNAYLPPLVGSIESRPKFQATGIHSHDDGVIHWHPYTAKASGANARLKVFLDNYDITLTSTKLAFPSDQEEGKVFEEGKTKCMAADGKLVDGEIKAFVWPESTKPDKFRVLTADIGNVHVTQNGMAIVIAFVPADVNSIPEPPTASNLEALGAADGGPINDEPTTTGAPTVPGESTVPGPSTVPSPSTLPGEPTVGSTVSGEPATTG